MGSEVDSIAYILIKTAATKKRSSATVHNHYVESALETVRGLIVKKIRFSVSYCKAPKGE
jgi:hypothetical protein